MYKKILVFICCVVLVSKTVSSQIISVEGVWHADSVQYAAPFSLEFWFVNTGNTSLFDSLITANIVISPVNANPLNGQILTFTQNIPQGVFAPGDSLYMLNNPLNGGPQLYQQAGDHTVIIWPSFVTPVTIDTSTTALYVLPQITSIFEDIELDINDANNMFYDLLGREIDNIINLPYGTMYFSRNGKKYLKL